MIAGLSLTAQNDDTKRADKHFAELEYEDAAEDYQKLVEKGKATPYVYKQLAESYFKLQDTKAAERYYAIVLEQDNAGATDYYRYAQLLKSNGKFEESKAAMKAFAAAFPNDGRAQAFKNDPGYFSHIMGQQPGFTIEKMEINSPASDFGGHLHNGKLYFVSARKGSRGGYLDVYTANAMGDGYGQVEKLPGDVNTKRHEGTVSIAPDGKTLYFTRNGKYEKGMEIGQLQIYRASWIAGEWTNVVPLPFNSNDYSTGHTALSPDGKTLYFASDMPGGYGDTDLYKVAIHDDGSFGEPQNLGSGINTVGRESFPFIGQDGTLYFTSNGHLGLGGLDIFSAKAQGGGFGQVKNLGAPVNSHQDDFVFVYYQNDKKAFISSNRGQANGLNDDIYTLVPIEKCEGTMFVMVVDADTQKPIAGATVSVHSGGKELGRQTSSPQGGADFQQPCGNYEVQADAQGYFSNATTTEQTGQGEVKITIALSPEPVITEEEVVLEPIFFEFDSAEITPEAALELDRLVRVMQERPEMKIQVRAHTDSRGSDAYNLALSDRRAKSTANYIIEQGIDASRISGEGFGETMPEVECGTNCTDEQFQQNRRSEFKIVKE